ncbi:hypothetical protein [Sphingobacterium corticibacter]|uniref:Uncharacterized protein n=1 Tax=Sphingobacterium corticibacter TaxID=2171749 RepID=A0A2T8HNQ5_9SPHI|nr:hypothetical protein [Sphingobacterium corticibacter]PVH27074.1 hypothetical protein DC487_05610 [Sphingobacterium corticibacter]
MIKTSDLYNNRNRKTYLNPEIMVQIINHESSIAAGSAKVTVGGTSNNHSPFIDDWQDGVTRSSDFTM